MSVNGVNVENVEHSFVIRLLKEAKDFIHLVIKRKINNHPDMDAELANCNENSISVNSQKQYEFNKRHNLAIQQTAATVMANFNKSQSDDFNNQHNKENFETNSNSNNLMTIMMNGTTSMSSLKPIKVTLNKKDKKDSFGIILGCKYYIQDIIADSIASTETKLRKGDILVKLNDLDPEQFSLNDAKKILKSKENKLNLVVKRNGIELSDEDALDSGCVSDEQIKETKKEENPVSNPANNSNYQNLNEMKTEAASFDNLNNTNDAKIQNQPNQSSNLTFKQLFRPIKASANNMNDSNNRMPKFYTK